MSTELSYEEVQSWCIDALKTYCRKRNLKVAGSKTELVAHVFAASEMGIPVQPTAEELVVRMEAEKAKLLQAPDNIMLPAPPSPQDGWLRENNGITLWPPLLLSDIILYLMEDHPERTLTSKNAF